MENTLKKESIISSKAYSFTLEIIVLHKKLVADKEFILSKQILRSGTSIGANINEALSAQSKRDFVYKLSISLKETRETIYWLNLLKDSNYINQEYFINLSTKSKELMKILSSIILTIKQKYFKTKSGQYSAS